MNNINQKDELEIELKFLSICDKLNSFKKNIKEVNDDIKNIEKYIKKSFKSYNKEINKKKKSKKPPSGFAQPSVVTKELCDFLNIQEGTKIARTEVTKSLINYINTNNLQKQDNKKQFTTDSKLKELLGIETSELDYFSLQKYMNKHFIKKNLVEAS